MDDIGSSGQLHDGAVEALHVIDNRHVARWANVKDCLQNITLRTKAAWQISNPGAQTLRAPDRQREEHRRERRSLRVRELRALAERKRAARFAEQEV